MTTRTRTSTILSLLIVALLASAYLIVAKNGAAMSGAGGSIPAGMFH